jgi:hypothetical protein
MRVVVVGATGNVGTSLLESLAIEEQVDEIVAIARRRPARAYPRTSFASADITASELEPIFRGADAVVHLAWLIQPARKESVTYTVNVSGSERVFRAAVQARVPAIVYASSVGAYSPGPKDRFVDPRAILSDVRGAFNLAAEPVLDPAELGAMLHARPVRIPARALRAAARSRSRCISSRASPAGSTWRSRCRCSTRGGPAGSSAGNRGDRRRTRSRS